MILCAHKLSIDVCPYCSRPNPLLWFIDRLFDGLVWAARKVFK